MLDRSAWTPAAALALALLLAVASPARADHAVILQYHHVSESTPRSTSVTPAEFAAHMEYLASAGCHVRPLPEVVAAWQRGEPIGDSVVCLTADDGYVSLYTEALPILRDHGWTMTVFVCSGDIDRGGRVYLSWDRLRALHAEGWAIESHADEHDHLTRRRDRESDAGWRARVSANIGRSLARIEKEIGTAPTLFAYPYGEYDPELAAMVRGLGLAGFGQQSGAAWSEADRATLPRFPVSGAYADLADLRVKAASLPLPVVEASPDSPVLTQEETRPALTLSIEWGDWSADGLAAYVSGQGGTPVVWADRARGRVRVQANRDLPPGRSRYNVTAPARNGGRWYWYSHPWIRPGGND